MNLLQIVESTTLTAQQIAVRTAQIHASVRSKSRYINVPNFTKIHSTDLQILFAQYDDIFFGGRLTESLLSTTLHFGMSKRMTSAGGKTACYTDRRSNHRQYQISVSAAILFECFHDDDHRPITACGIVCRDRLEALQRVIEHEFVHLIELLLWDESSCSKARFHSITWRFFGHSENKHQLITPKERAIVTFGIKPGMLVRFRFDGIRHTGVVRRITKRATVLVEDVRGIRYTNGKAYATFYVPVQSLEAVE